MEKRSVLQKVVLISVAAMAVAFAILTFVFHRLEGVKFEEGFLRVSAQADDPAATVYAGKIQGERVKITVTDCPDEQRTAVEVQVGDRVRDECVVETGLPPIQADQLGPVEHIRITTGIPLPCPFPIAALLETITGSIMKRIEGRFSALPVGRSW
ncbi:MAG: hypothetical protein KHW60_08345 [Oscillibacter sp.]|nr:hypothetical protein [Oscillibacter sp.]